MYGDSTMSPMMSLRPAPAYSSRAWDNPIPIEDEAIAERRLGAFRPVGGGQDAVRRPVIIQRWPPSRMYPESRVTCFCSHLTGVVTYTAIQMSFVMNSSSSAYVS